ncbi:hypothetical protein MKW98_013240 [Papaver atlanticum]|uniref:tRNA pseudouridine(55) synthase n=1 Tax=Papaver atlanticum TaxID=357466 RepID=A0AAD4XER1_9MAGN|nr:hypothetical protein MKW98_013240 [Papaver atlanticum]
MAKSLSLSHVSLLILRPKPRIFSAKLPVLPTSRLILLNRTISLSSSLSFSTTATPYPLQYDLIISRPSPDSLPPPRRRKSLGPISATPGDSESSSETTPLDNWVNKKMSSLDKSKRKYYNKRRQRMYGSDESDDDGKVEEDKYIELKQEVVEFPSLHKREEELYFYDAFAYPWEKDKHYKMVYQLEKKYFPDQCLDKAFVQPGQVKPKGKAKGLSHKDDKSKGSGESDKGMVFFDEEERNKENKDMLKLPGNGIVKDVSEKKVGEFFKCLKKVPSEGGGEIASVGPYLLTRKTELPPRFDGPYGTVVLVNKPKGWTSFTVCGKLRRLVKVQKVGHAGTLDPMATGLLIVCVGKATKVVDSYQGMVKGYSGVFRLGEATSTWDADSPVIQREPWEHIKDAEIKKIAASFCGEIWQVPPMFSAIKVGGEKMYDKARRGETVELAPRRISIFQFDIERSLSDRQNLVFRVTCSKGTYIRSLCADLGKALGSCAHLTALRRDSIGEYSADDAWDFPELEQAITKSYF